MKKKVEDYSSLTKSQNLSSNVKVGLSIKES